MRGSPIRLIVAGILIPASFATALAQNQPNATAAPPAGPLTPTSLAIPWPIAPPPTAPAQNGTAQPGAAQAGAIQTGASQTGASQVGATQVGAAQSGAARSGAAKTGPTEIATFLTGTPQAGPTQAATSLTGTRQTATPQTSTVPTETPQLAIVPPDTTRIDASQNSTPKPAVHRSMTPAAAAARGIRVVTTQHSNWGRISFVLRGNPAPEVRSTPDGIEVHLAPGVHLDVSPSAQLRETGPIEVRDDGGAAVALIHLTCHCTPEQDNDSGVLRFNIHPAPTPAPQPGTQPVAAAKDAVGPQLETVAKTPAGMKPEPPVQSGPEAKTAERAKPEPPAKSEGGAQLGTEAKAETGVKPASSPKIVASDAAARTVAEPKPATAAKPTTAAKPSEAEEMARLRAFLTEKLAKLNANPPQVTPSASRALMSDAAASKPVTAPRPNQTSSTGPAGGDAVTPSAGTQSTTCLARVDASNWRGAGSFTERLVALRFQAARSHSTPEDVANLAEFYLANGLGHEALAAATEALAMEASPQARLRLTRDADIGSLIKGEKLSPESPLLSNPVDCKRADAVLWRDLAAAAGGDAEGAARDPEIAATALRLLPEPLQRELAFRIVKAVGDNLDALRAMAGAMRNETAALPEDEARRFLLQARIAGLTGDQAEYAVYLERAARFDMTAPGVIAKSRLAAVRAAEGGPDAAHSEAVLIDIARTYRNDALGQEAAEQYAELLLRRHDYATALAIADESAGPHGSQTRESRGATLVLRILRLLFVDPATAELPDPNARIALFLRYGGYATPGEKGDDIRLAAARLMLAQRLPDAALDTLHQLSDASAATPEAAQMLATAEAYGGDPAKAMELVKALPDNLAAHRIASEALRRMRQPLQAAHALDGETGVADREWRASLLFEAEAWPDAVAAYADLLGDPTLSAARRNDLATRYALAMAMSGSATNVTSTKLPEAPARLLSVLPSAAPAVNGKPPALSSLRGALERARHIETLLDPPTAHQGS